MSEKVVEILTASLKAQNSGWAEAEDSAKAVIRVAADTSINGRSLSARLLTYWWEFEYLLILTRPYPGNRTQSRQERRLCGHEP
jgi:hypothetical protein